MEVVGINRPRNTQQEYFNDSIPFNELLVITDTGEKLGVLKREEALRLTYEKELDLVIVNANSKPPVGKMMDYSKFRYEQQRKQREMRKNQKIITVKEIRLSPVIGDHDVLTKLNQAKKFIASGDKVKITLRFRGRMITHANQGFQVVNSFIEKFEDTVIIEQKPKMEGRVINAVIAPNTKK